MNAPASEPLVLVARDGAVLRADAQPRVGARNALSEGLMAALQNALDDAAANAKSVRVVIVIGAEGPWISPPATT